MYYMERENNIIGKAYMNGEALSLIPNKTIYIVSIIFFKDIFLELNNHNQYLVYMIFLHVLLDTQRQHAERNS